MQYYFACSNNAFRSSTLPQAGLSHKLDQVKLSAYDLECLETAKQKIDEDLAIHHKIEELAHIAGMGSTKLKTGFKQKYGTGVYTYLRSQRMLKAKELLETGDKPLKAIAKEAGFNYVSNFVVAFKKEFGTTPGKIN